MVLLVPIFYTMLICTLPVTNGDIDRGGEINSHDVSADLAEQCNQGIHQYVNSVIGPIDPDLTSLIDGDKDSTDLAEHGNQGLHQHVDSVNGPIDPNLTSLIDGDKDSTDKQFQHGVMADEEVDTFSDEELQQDLPDIWSDTGQFLTGILDTSGRQSERASSLGIAVSSPSEAGDAVECPPPVVPVTPTLCGAPACLTNIHCREPDMACCFNGCVHTCLSPLDAPAVIDWLEDTSLHLPMLDEASGVPRFPVEFEGSSSIAYAQGGGEAVHLQGGCTITSQQYNQLRDFMTRTTIQDCSCTDGEVVCAVKPYKAVDE